MKKCFLTGLAILLPATLTIAILVFIINFLTTPFLGFMRDLLGLLGFNPTDSYLLVICQIIVLIVLFFITVIIGFGARAYFISSLIRISDIILLKIPFINSLYKATQEIIKTLFSSPKNSFKKVALVPYPNKDTYTIGLVTGKGLEICQTQTQEKLLSVYIPTTPNPTSGYLLMFKEKDVIMLDMKIDEAMKYIISCGVLQDDKQVSSTLST